MQNYIFLTILILILIVPFLIIMAGKYNFRKSLSYGIPAIFISGFLFLLWDIRFTEAGVWSYNPDFTLGIFYKGLPLEQWLFYLVFPCSGLMVYELIKARFSTLDWNIAFTAVSLLIVAGLAIAAYVYRAQVYTSYCSLFTAVYFGYTIFRMQFRPHLTHFFLTYLAILVPYFVLSEILSRNLAIEYHQEQILSFRLFMVPVENLVFLFFLMLMNTTIYEYFSERRFF